MNRNKYVLTPLLIFTFILSVQKLFSQVTVTSSDSLSCTVLCTTLTAHVEGDAPTTAGITSDDIYSALIPIGFTYRFYGTNYTQLVIGANGTLGFTPSLAGTFDPYTISAALLGNASKLNSICGPWCDIDIFYTGPAIGTETYSTDGIAPFRKFAVTWCNCSMFSCGTQRITTQIIIYEGSNIAEVHITRKEICPGWQGGHAIVGVQNSAGTAATTAPGRDFPSVWAVPPTEAWRFTPNAAGTAYTVASIPYAPIPYASSAVYWYNATTGAYLGTGLTQVVCPTTTTTYKAGALGCADTSWGYYTVTPSGSLLVTSTFANPSQCGLCDGTITLSGMIPGSIDTIRYSKDGVPQPAVIGAVSAAGTMTLTGLCAGSYTGIKVSQGACTSLPISVTLVDPPISISGVVQTNPSICGACDGSLVLTGLYASHVFTVTYTLGGVPQPALATTSTPSGTISLTGLCAGTYDNIIASFGSCITPPKGPYTLVNPPISISGVTKTDASFCGVCDGILVLHGLYPSHAFTVTYTFNGVAQPPVTAVSNASGDITLTGLCEGTYDNIVASYGVCITPPVGPYDINTPPLPPGRVFASVNPSECGFCNGSITIMGLPPFSSDTVKYFKDGVPQTTVTSALSDSSIYLSGLCKGNYTGFTVKIGKCTYNITGAATLTESLIKAILDTSIHFGCNGDTVLFTNTSTSTGPLYYIWDFGDGASDTVKNATHIFQQGTYTITLVATNHHCFDTATIALSLLHPLKAGFVPEPMLLCQGEPMLFGDTSHGTSPIDYAWSFGDGGTSTAQSPTHTFVRTGTYNVRLIITDWVPCNDTAVVAVEVDTTSGVVMLTTDSVLCAGTYITLTGLYAPLGNTGITWSFNNTDSILDVNPLKHAFNTAGTYTVSVTPHYRACKDVTTRRVITVMPQPTISLGEDTSICAGSEMITLKDDLNGTNGAASWRWSNGSKGPSTVIVAPGIYFATVSINNCYASDTIVVRPDCYMNIPNVFSPNGDGINDYFYPRSLLTKGLTTFKMSIYNRWGQLIFETSSLDGAGWDGRMNDVPQPQGVYVYVIDATFRDAQKEHHQGNVTLMR